MKFKMKTLQIEITNGCNFRCKHCFAINPMSYSWISLTDYKFLIDDAVSNGFSHIILTGGEVLTHKNFLDMYNYAYDNHLFVSVFTNGYLLNDEVIDLFKIKKPYSIEITLYGLSHEKFQDFTSMKNLNYIKPIVYISKLKENRLNVKAKYIVHKRNLDEISDFVKFCNDLEIKFQISSTIFSSKERPQSIESLGIIDKIELEKYLHSIKYYSEIAKRENLNCNAYSTHFIVRTDLVITGCYFVTDSPLLNHNGHNLNDIIKSLQIFWNEKTSKFEDCSKCQVLNFCDFCLAHSDKRRFCKNANTRKNSFKRFFNYSEYRSDSLGKSGNS